ncbi:hypothetical protein D3C84_832180 [compost metagenome]
MAATVRVAPSLPVKDLALAAEMASRSRIVGREVLALPERSCGRMAASGFRSSVVVEYATDTSLLKTAPRNGVMSAPPSNVKAAATFGNVSTTALKPLSTLSALSIARSVNGDTALAIAVSRRVKLASSAFQRACEVLPRTSAVCAIEPSPEATVNTVFRS